MVRRSKSKYLSKKAIYDGKTFDSKKEKKRYQELRLLEEAGAISGLRTQVKFILIPTQREPDRKGPRGGVIPGKVIERECSYIADFVYVDNETEKTVVEDVKGFRNSTAYDVFVIKRKLMYKEYQIKVREV